MAASSESLTALIDSVDADQPIDADRIQRAHHILMRDDPRERANQSDIEPVVEAALVHAQFESIHPFTDGNGRIGRALINTVMRRRGLTRSIVIPIASALVARRVAYFNALTQFRTGDAGPITSMLARGTDVAAREAAVTAARLAELPAEWSDQADNPRAGSAARRILERLLDHPIFSADDLLGESSESAAYRLIRANIIHPVTNRKRNQVWVATGVADELEALGLRIADRARQWLRRAPGRPLLPSN